MVSKDFHGGSLKILYSKEDHERRKNLFHLQLFFMKLAGQVPINAETCVPKMLRRSASCLTELYCIFSAISTLHLAVLFTKTTYDMFQMGELEEITDALTMTIIYSFATFATCYWLLRRKPLRNFIKDINEHHRHHSLAGLTFVSVNTSYSLAYKLTKYWLISCIMGVLFWALNPLILGSYTLPLKCWYPFNPLGERSTMRTINLMQYLALTISELIMFTYFGELLRSHSIRSGEAFFRSQWWPNAHYIKKDILIFLSNTNRVVKLTAGKFYLMDIDRLRKVVTQAFSFLTLLQKLEEKNK